MSDIPAAFDFLHRRMQRDFGATFKTWWPADALGTNYTVSVECHAGPIGAKGAALLGQIQAPQDAIAVHVTAGDLPFEPRPEHLFIYGVTAATGKKYRVITAAKAQINQSHYRITAERV